MSACWLCVVREHAQTCGGRLSTSLPWTIGRAWVLFQVLSPANPLQGLGVGSSPNQMRGAWTGLRRLCKLEALCFGRASLVFQTLGLRHWPAFGVDALGLPADMLFLSFSLPCLILNARPPLGLRRKWAGFQNAKGHPAQRWKPRGAGGVSNVARGVPWRFGVRWSVLRTDRAACGGAVLGLWVLWWPDCLGPCEV